MMLRSRWLACALAALCLLAAPMAVAEDISGISWMMDIYGSALPEDVPARMAEGYAPETVDLGDITLTFDEVLCDGRWLYTCVKAMPNDPDAVLIMPGSAWAEDLVSGGYGEGLREDDRTFQEAAAQDGKRLVSVYAYPALLDDLPEYFLDHLQMADNVSLLISGGMVSLAEEETLATEWIVHTFDIDPASGEPLDDTRAMASYPLRATILTPTGRRAYRVDNPADVPFDTLTLVKTPLAVYADIAWHGEDDPFLYSHELLDENGAAYPRGAATGERAYAMDALPETLQMSLQRDDVGAEAVLLTLSAE